MGIIINYFLDLCYVELIVDSFLDKIKKKKWN